MLEPKLRPPNNQRTSNQRALSAGSCRIVLTSSAPCTGGLEYIGRATSFICDSTRAASSGESHTIENAPTRWP